MLGRWLQSAARSVDHRHGVFHSDRLPARRLNINLGASQAGKDEGLFREQQMGAIEFGGDMHREIEVPHRLERDFRIGHRNGKIAAKTDQSLRAPVPDRLDRFDRVVALLRGGSNPKTRASPFRSASFGTSVIPTVRSPCTLEWPRSGEMPAPLRPILPRSINRLAICCTLPVP